MDIDFDTVKETVRTVALRLDSPSSKYNFVFSESDTAVEVCVEDSNATSPLFVFVVDEERFRVLKSLDLDPEGFVTYPYHSYVELLSFIIEQFYPVFFKLTSNGKITDMLSRILGQRVRVWKDLLRVICEAGQVEFVDRGKVFKVLDTNFWYTSKSHTLSVSGELNDTYKCPTVMELVITLLTILAYIFKLNNLDANPILGVQEVEEAGDTLFEEEMDMGADIDSMDMGGDMDAGGGMGAGEDLSEEFAPAGDSIENTAPEIDAGKEEIMDEVNAAIHRVPKGFTPIFSKANKGMATQVDEASQVSICSSVHAGAFGGLWVSPSGKVYEVEDGEHGVFMKYDAELFGFSPSRVEDNEDLYVDKAVQKGWLRVRWYSDPSLMIGIKKSPSMFRSLVKRVGAVLSYGFSVDTPIQLDIQSQDGTVETQFTTINELTNMSSSYTPLQSEKKYAIFSSGGFANADLIVNLKQNVLRGLGSSASWVFNDPVSSDGGLLNWSSTLSIKGKDHSVVFVQKGNQGDLVVVVGEKRILVGRYGAFDAKFLRAFWGALGVRV
jgi:hypothetical protein